MDNAQRCEPDDEIIEILVRHYIPAPDAARLAPAVQELQRTYPKLSEDEINQIADTVSERFVEHWAGQMKPSEKEHFAGKIRSVARDVLIGLASSAIYSLLLYLLNVRASAAPAQADIEDTEANARRYRTLTKRLSAATQRELDVHSVDLDLWRISLMHDVVQEAERDAALQEFLDRIRPRFSGGPLESMFYDNFTKFVHSGLTSSAYAKLEGAQRDS